MAPYISGKHKGIHILNLAKTAYSLSETCDLVFDAARCYYVNKKWLGSISMNLSTIETRCHKFKDLGAKRSI
ncbi:hypothetical protein AMTRI_Chr10g231140 [Amborella trichopoda]